MKKDREAKKLELLEAEVMKRLRDTHLRQQQAIEEIQDIFSKRDVSTLQMDPIAQTYMQPHTIAYPPEGENVVSSMKEIITKQGEVMDGVQEQFD